MEIQEKHTNNIIPILQTTDTVDLRLMILFTVNKLHQIGYKRLIKQTNVNKTIFPNNYILQFLSFATGVITYFLFNIILKYFKKL